MKFGPVPLDEAEGKILGHNIAAPDGRRAFRKGRPLTADDLAALRRMGRTTVYAAEPEPGDVDEDSAARRLAHAAAGTGLRLAGPASGRVNLLATAHGLLRVDVARLARINACGGTIEVFVETLRDEWYTPLRDALTAEGSAGSATVVRGPYVLLGQKVVAMEDGSCVGAIAGAGETALAMARESLAAGRSERRPLEALAAEVFVESHQPAPTLVMVGGVHIAKALGYRTVVVDPRRAFGSQARFPHVDRLVQAWPDEALKEIGLTPTTAVAMLTHDPKLDDPALKLALPSPAFYVGALGSQRTQAARRKRLLAEGLSTAHLARLHGPIGMDIGAEAPEEIALSIMAEIVVARRESREGSRELAGAR